MLLWKIETAPWYALRRRAEELTLGFCWRRRGRCRVSLREKHIRVSSDSSVYADRERQYGVILVSVAHYLRTSQTYGQSLRRTVTYLYSRRIEASKFLASK